jgi:hypothetical protein
MNTCMFAPVTRAGGLLAANRSVCAPIVGVSLTA